MNFQVTITKEGDRYGRYCQLNCLAACLLRKRLVYRGWNTDSFVTPEALILNKQG